MKKNKDKKQNSVNQAKPISTEARSFSNSRNSKKKNEALSQSLSLTRRGVKRVIRNNSSHQFSTIKKAVVKKVDNSIKTRKRMIKAECSSVSEDSQANKENIESPIPAIRKRGRKKANYNKQPLDIAKVHRNVVDEPMVTPNSKSRTNEKNSQLENSGENDEVSKEINQSL